MASTELLDTTADGQMQEETSAVLLAGGGAKNAGAGSARPKEEVFEEIQHVLKQSPVLQLQFFDFRVRQHLHALFGTGGRQRLKAALTMVHARTMHRTRQDVKNWPAYLVTLLKNFDPHREGGSELGATKVKSRGSSATTTPEKTERFRSEAESSDSEDDARFEQGLDVQKSLEDEGKLLEKTKINRLEGRLLEKQSRVDDLERKLQDMQAHIDSLMAVLNGGADPQNQLQRAVQRLKENEEDVVRLREENEKLSRLAQTWQAWVDHLEEELQRVGDSGDLVQIKEDLTARLATRELASGRPAQRDEERWQFQGDSGEWVPFPERANQELMGKFRQGLWHCEVSVHGKVYAINFREGWQINQRTGKTRWIRCFFDVPIHWKLTIEEAFQFLTPAGANFVARTVRPVRDPLILFRLQGVLNRSRSRHDGASCWCSHGSSSFQVLEAFQVKNLHVWRRYQRFLQSIREKHHQLGISPEACPAVGDALTEFAHELQVDQAGNERLLLHGTRDLETAMKIALEGFDNRVRERPGLYGQGTYFAAQTCKSAQYATNGGTHYKASSEMMGTMLFARVAIGHPFYAEGPCHERTRNRLMLVLLGQMFFRRAR
ncbi:unnamed protein product [Durusdinium trenchii]|uniref:WWE domain-containing protein n=1 Tax=Durusdinium trenchii TaxID=1381693 RepID=A0ABP0QPB1_9DINO